MRDECKGPGGLATTACMDRDHDRLDNSCVKWMYQFYHVTKQSEGWRKCSDFDYSRHSRGTTLEFLNLREFVINVRI